MEKILPKNIGRLVAVLLLAFGITFLFLMTVSSFQPASALHQEFNPVETPISYLELSVEPPIVIPGELITLHIVYHNIGLPYTRISINPSNIVIYEPPLDMPCKYDQHPNGCTAITLRTLTTGVVTFSAWANGEVFDPDCQCWIFDDAYDNGPATAAIVNKISYLFLPVLLR